MVEPLPGAPEVTVDLVTDRVLDLELGAPLPETLPPGVGAEEKLVGVASLDIEPCPSQRDKFVMTKVSVTPALLSSEPARIASALVGSGEKTLDNGEHVQGTDGRPGWLLRVVFRIQTVFPVLWQRNVNALRTEADPGNPPVPFSVETRDFRTTTDHGG